MPESALTIYQSGQTVAIAGTYEVVGSKRRTQTAATGEFPVRDLNIGDIFPNFEGRSVGWHLVRTTEQAAPSGAESPQRTAQ